MDPAKKLKIQVDRIRGLICQHEELLNDLVMRVPFKGSVVPLSFRRTRSGRFRIFFHDKPAADCTAEEKILAAGQFYSFYDEYIAHLQKLTTQAEEIARRTGGFPSEQAS